MVYIDRRNATERVSEWGHEQNDTILGSAFNDLLRGGRGDDVIYGGAGNDRLEDQVTSENLTLNDWALPDFLAQPPTDDEMEVAFSQTTPSNFLFPTDSGGNDSFYGDAGNDRLAGYDGDDLLDGGADNDGIWGGNGNDRILGGDGLDTLFGNDGDDTMFGDAGADSMRGGIGNDQMNGGADNDLMLGGNGNDTLSGGSGADTLRGGEGDDHFDGGSGADFIDGDTGLDTLSYVRSDAAVDVDLERTVQIGGDAEGDNLFRIDNITASLRSDILRGDDNANRLSGFFGSDTLEGRGGADTLDGGTGSAFIDIASYESSDAAVNIDMIRATQQGGDAQGDTLIGIEGVIGSRFADQISGDDANNVFNGGFGNDTIDGRNGVDTLDLSSWNDPLLGFPGATPIVRSVSVTLRDTTDGTASRFENGGRVAAETDTLRSIENVLGTNLSDAITGNGADNLLDGRAGNDRLNGGGGADVLLGGDGADTLIGGAGADSMTGGTGADVFTFNAFNEMTALSGTAFDTIRDFQSGTDRIDLTGLGDLTFVSSLQGIAGQVQLITGALNGVNIPALVIDRNGDNVADHVVFIQTSGPFPLSSDLLII